MIRIITDAAADMPIATGEKLGVKILPITTSFGEKQFKAPYELKNEEFYDMLVSETEMPKTAQVTPFEFEEVFQEIIDAGDEAVVILLSSDLSGTVQSAMLAVSNLETDKITVIDSKNVSAAQGVLVIEAVKLRDAGKSREEIVKTIESYIPRLRLFMLLDTLVYLRKGGRISPSIAFIGEAIKLRPIITVADGKVVIADKAKGNKAGVRRLLAKFEEYPVLEGTTVVLGHSNAFERAEELKSSIEEQGACNVADNWCIGPVVGTHAGPGAIAVYYISQNE